MFHNKKCNLIELLSTIGILYHVTLLYNRSTNTVTQDDIAGREIHDKYKKDIAKHWNRSSVGFLKWKTNASRVESWHSTTIGIVQETILASTVMK